MVKQSEAIQGTEKEFLNEFHKLCYSRSSWQVWADLMTAIACSISNVADRSPEHEDTCSMCGKFCAVRSMNKALAGEYIDIL